MTAPMPEIHDTENSLPEPPAKAAQPPTRLGALAILAIVVTGIAVAFIAQSFGLSFRLSIALSALVVGISISIVHYFQDSGAAHSESRSQHN